jgi:hypothetical protein
MRRARVRARRPWRQRILWLGVRAQQTLIVNRAFAEKFFPGENVIGKRITPGATGPGETQESIHEIVGVVGSAKLFALDVEPQPIYYFPYRQLVWQAPVVMLRTSVPPRTRAERIGTQIARAFGSILRKLLIGVVSPWRLERQTSTVSR